MLKHSENSETLDRELLLGCRKIMRNFMNLLQFNSVTQSCPTLCDPMNRSMPGLPLHHQLLEFTQTHILRVSDAIQPSHPLSSPSPPAPNPSQHQSLFQRVNSSHEVAKVLEFQLQHQPFQKNTQAGSHQAESRQCFAGEPGSSQQSLSSYGNHNLTTKDGVRRLSHLLFLQQQNRKKHM